MNNSKEPYSKLWGSLFQQPDRIGMADAYWEDTLARWREEGLPPDVDLNDCFGFDFDWIYMVASLRLPEKLQPVRLRLALSSC